jgi:hypothetical protein
VFVTDNLVPFSRGQNIIKVLALKKLVATVKQIPFSIGQNRIKEMGSKTKQFLQLSSEYL